MLIADTSVLGILSKVSTIETLQRLFGIRIYLEFSICNGTIVRLRKATYRLILGVLGTNFSKTIHLISSQFLRSPISK